MRKFLFITHFCKPSMTYLVDNFKLYIVMGSQITSIFNYKFLLSSYCREPEIIKTIYHSRYFIQLVQSNVILICLITNNGSFLC